MLSASSPLRAFSRTKASCLDVQVEGFCAADEEEGWEWSFLDVVVDGILADFISLPESANAVVGGLVKLLNIDVNVVRETVFHSYTYCGSVME